MKIVRTDAELYLPTLDDRLRTEGHDLVLLPDGISQEALIEASRDADILMMCYTPVTRAVIQAAPKLRGIVKYGVGIDAIDIQAAKDHGVAVVNVPEYAENTVAEGAFLLMLALLRKLPARSAAMRASGASANCGAPQKNSTILVEDHGRRQRGGATCRVNSRQQAHKKGH